MGYFERGLLLTPYPVEGGGKGLFFSHISSMAVSSMIAYRQEFAMHLQSLVPTHSNIISARSKG